MKYKTTFNIGDTAFLLEDRECYKCIIKEIKVDETKDGVKVQYIIDKIVARGLLSSENIEKEISEKNLFISKGEAATKLKEIEKAEEVVKEFSKNHSNIDEYYYDSISRGLQTFRIK